MHAGEGDSEQALHGSLEMGTFREDAWQEPERFCWKNLCSFTILYLYGKPL